MKNEESLEVMNMFDFQLDLITGHFTGEILLVLYHDREWLNQSQMVQFELRLALILSQE